MSFLLVGGRFDDVGGKASGLAKILFDNLDQSTVGWGHRYPDGALINGGFYNNLEDYMPDIAEFDTVYWLAELQEDRQMLSRFVKKASPRCVYVGSVKNLDGKIGFRELIADSLAKKSNLNVEFSSMNDKYSMRIFDPLGNVFLDYNPDPAIVAKVLLNRVNDLHGFLRMRSSQLGKSVEVPDEQGFFDIVKQYGEVFHNLISPPENSKFLGNASFRCRYGFPSFRHNGEIFVSMRNVDKREIGRESFVRVIDAGDCTIGYYGNSKPSVDAPIQLRLYDFYKNVRYMIHGHAYVENAEFTNRIIPCGALDEVGEIKLMFPDDKIRSFAVNLSGHGSVVFADKVEKLKDIIFTPRPMPEYNSDYHEDSWGGEK